VGGSAFLGAALAAAPAQAQTLVLHDGDRRHVLGEVATVLVDPSGKLSPSQLVAPENSPRFKPVESRHPNLGYTGSTLWFRFTLQNAERSERRFVLDISREWLESVRMVEIDGGETLTSGAWVPLHSRPIATERIAFPVELPGGATRSYLLSMASRTPVSLLGSVVPREAFFDAEATRNLAFGGFYAILLALAAYNVIVSLVSREGTHALLGGGLTSYALAEACAHGQVARFLPAVAGFAELSGCSAAFGVFTGCFGAWAYRMFEVTDRLRRFDRAFRAAIAGSVLCCLIAALLPRLHLLTFVGILLLIAALLPGTVLRARRADRIGIYLAVALAALIVPGSVVIGALFGLWPLNSGTERRLRLLGPSGEIVGDLSEPRSSIGQLPSNDVVLADRSVSRFHCEILLEHGQARVRDLESRNGTWLDRTRVVEAFLADGAELKLGRTVLRVSLGEERPPQPLSVRTEMGPLVGRSVAMRAAFALLEKAAPTGTTVLIEGETGTGKEGAAEALHLGSPRRDRPLTVVDCGAIPANLMESELFGHAKGAFTGATGPRIGAFEEADGGTIFLDEIGELPLELQPKLLRVLERKEIRRVGSNSLTPVDVRVVAATHRDLRSAVNHGTFRADLYFRLSVVRIRLPPLRERADDIPTLVAHFVGRMGVKPDVAAELLRPEFIASLLRASWPGNVRELRNFIERCVVFQLPLPVEEPAAPAPASFAEARQRAIDEFERRFLEELMLRHDGKVSAAAQQAGIGRAYLYRLLHKHGVSAKAGA